jgi:hypothetical protein
VLAIVAGAAVLVVPALTPATSAATRADGEIVLVVLRGAGTAGYLGPLPRPEYRDVLLATQDDVLEGVDAEPVYRWTTALNGFAASLTPEEVELVEADPAVTEVERNAVLPLSATRATSLGAGPVGPGSRGPGRGGAGQVVGVVDTGIWTDSPVFAPVPGLGRDPQDFRGGCDPEDAGLCTDKVVGAQWFVAGFGADDRRSTSALSALDDHGHGTQVASVAAGNAAVSVDVPGQPEGRFSGTAPRARIAAYKACWTAPDPDDDGCATADLVSAVDRAVHDRVDVLLLAVAGNEPGSALESALLGAAEAGVVVVGAAGNDGRASYAAHASPWVTTVGATTGPVRTGRLVLPGGPTVTGAMAATRGRHDVRLVAGADAVAEGATPAEARQCREGALDAARVRGAVVLCERGGTARVEKSAAVRRADGVGMVLVNRRPGAVVADLHVVPTLHLRQDDGAAVRSWLRRHPHGRVDLLPDRSTSMGAGRPARVPAWSEPGDPSGAVLKPDLVATGTGVLAATPPSVRGLRWDLVGGTSVASARVAGLAASLLARHDWSAAEVRSALATTAAPVAASSLRAGSGRAGLARADAPGLGFPVERGAYRAWSADFLREANTPSVLLSGSSDRAVRTVENLGPRRATWSARVVGLDSHRAVVRPATFTLRPGQRVQVRLRVVHPEAEVHPLDDGYVVWRGTDGSVVRVPVALVR